MEFDDERDQLLSAIAKQTDAMRELLSYCRAEAETLDLDNLSDEFNPYDDIAYKLAQILDGEQ